MRYIALIPVFLLCGCTPLTQTSADSDSNSKTLALVDTPYEPSIKTISLHPAANVPQEYMQPAVTTLGQWNLVLEFDDLRQQDTYYARIVHCNYDWSKSGLHDLDFMNDFNEFPINNFEYSVDTHIPYVHYWLNLPPVKLPGNYVVVVYRGGDKNDIVLSKRFMVFDPRVKFENERNLIGPGSIAALNQQINFTVNYKDVEVINPLENVKVVIRQNQRWDNIAVDVRPSFVRETEKLLEYRFFDDAKMFKGGNEFRFFDLRSLNSPGRNVARVDKTVRPFEVFIQRDKSRADEVYSQYLDLNGGFIPGNLDYRDIAYSNYAYVNFSLSAPSPLPGKVYVAGGFNYWNLNQDNLMRYDSAKREYQSRVLLRQGWYDYQYLVKAKDLPPYVLEGTHFETENFYEIFVYYRPFQPRADLLVGYIKLAKNIR